MIAYQLAKPEIAGWKTYSPVSNLTLEVSRLGHENWSSLGTFQIGLPFQLPDTFGPVPLFRTKQGERYLYIGVRKIELEGTSNFRDIGGYLNSDISQINFGKIFRSDNLARLTNSDWEIIDRLGIGQIIDLRHNEEKARSQTIPPKGLGIEITEIPIDVEIFGRSELLEHILSKEIKKITDEDMAQMYQDLLSKFRSELTHVVTLLLDPSKKSKIVHCTAGKDRTGLSVALVLLMCNVPQPQIMSDFLLSNAFRTPARIAALSEKLKSHQVEIEDIIPYLSASKPALTRAFETLDAQYGGTYNYLNFDEMSSRIGTDWQGCMLTPSTIL